MFQQVFEPWEVGPCFAYNPRTCLVYLLSRPDRETCLAGKCLSAHLPRIALPTHASNQIDLLSGFRLESNGIVYPKEK